MNLTTIVGHVGGRCKGDSSEQAAWKDAPVTSAVIKTHVHQKFDKILDLVDRPHDRRSFDKVERGITPLVYALVRLILAYHCAVREERSDDEIAKWTLRGYRVRDRTRKQISTMWGQVVIWRTYVRIPGGLGLFPLDRVLRITADGFSLLVMQTCARLATLVSYEQVTGLMLYFRAWSPSKTTVEKAVLGLGRHTQGWFEAAPAPPEDGEVLVIQVDSKATPTATDEELEKRRGKRDPKKRPPSPRHRGREKRARRGPKKRRKKGDKSKNGRAATIVTMYTLQKGEDADGTPALLGPINKRVYASYAPKRHAFAIARREANKRGFGPDSGRKIQIVTDGDEDLARSVKDLFPEAQHTLDIVHVLEYLWEAGRLQYKEGSPELTKWVKGMEQRLYRGQISAVIEHVRKLETDAVTEKSRDRLSEIRTYLTKRISMMGYNKLRREDLEVASGAVEGAVRHVIGKRFDSSGMRWILERAEALLQLRCIEINGDWDAFVDFATKEARAGHHPCDPVRLLTRTPAELPTLGVDGLKACA